MPRMRVVARGYLPALRDAAFPRNSASFSAHGERWSKRGMESGPWKSIGLSAYSEPVAWFALMGQPRAASSHGIPQ